MTSNRRSGFVLAIAVAMLAITAIVLGGVFSYLSNAARMTRIHVARSRCRLAAQSAIEHAKYSIQNGFSRYTGANSGASVRIDPRQAEAYNWFDNLSADHRTIGVAKDGIPPVTLVSPTNINDCVVYVAVGRKVDHSNNASIAVVPIVATAKYTYPDGLSEHATIQERVCFSTGQSHVFDYAYFVNNYGWMNGSSIIINGDMRANGNVNVNQSVVNGFIYAAANEELNVDGYITLSSAKIYSQSHYRSQAGNSARVDKTEYDIPGAYNAPKNAATGQPSTGTSLTLSRSTRALGTNRMGSDTIISEAADPIPMPYVSDLSAYVEYAQELGGTLKCPAYSYTDSAGTSHKINASTVNAHYDGVGPSGNAALADNGSIVLIGTQANPIEVNGPVVVDSDVIIKGYVKGQGTIYSGRNIHIIGDLRYLNAPTWSHSGNQTTSKREIEANEKKDLLGLVAKGNIVIGDCSSSTWHSSVDKYINGGSSSVVEKYTCDESDQDIGYPYPEKFCGSYTAVETTGSKLKVRTDNVVVGTHTETTYDKKGRATGTKVVEDKKLQLVNAANRKYYETVCDDKILSSLATAVTRIDGVLYNNHGIFGAIGSGSGVFNLNGSIVCRDEGLIGSGGGIRFNWDMRLRPRDGSNITDLLGLPVGPQDPYTVSWQEVPDTLNPSWPTAGGGK